MRWTRGLLRLWVALSVVWVASVGYREYSADPWIDIHEGGECWDHLAMWPDGKRFAGYELYFNDAPDGSDNANDRWKNIVRGNLKACQQAEPIVQRWTDWVGDNGPELQSALLAALLPPFALLIFGLCVLWIVSGFKPKTRA
jgi:hypothetical protein